MSERLGQSRTPTTVELLRAAVNQAIGGIFVALPGKVEKYDATIQKANIKPLLKRAVINYDGSEELDEIPIINDVPIIFPRGGGFFMTLPLAVGDNVLLIFMDRSIDNFVYSSGTVDLDPQDLRTHDISDAVAIPGFFPFTKPITDVVVSDAVFGKEKGAQVRGKSSTIEITSGGLPSSIGGFVAMAQLVMAELSNISTALTTHVHTGVTTGPGTSGSAAPIYIPGAVASTNLKAN